MSNAKQTHTPGPWQVRNDCGLAVDAHGGTVALINTIEECGDADAHLIAAAPTMYALLERIAETTCDHGPQEFCPRSEARKVLEQASGKAYPWVAR